MHTLKGQKFVRVFSYNLTFYSFYEVIKETKKTFTIAQLGKKTVGGENFFPIVEPDGEADTDNAMTVRKSNLHPSGNGFFFKGKSYSLYHPDYKYQENHLD